jgi:PleD family two-component response regulator
MSRQARIIVFGEDTPATRRLVDDLSGEAFHVAAIGSPAQLQADEGPPDLVLIDASARPDFLDDVRACRQVYPPQTTGVLVVGEPDPNASAAAIEAGATDSVADALAGPMLTAHVRRLLRASESLRTLLEEERRRAKQESLALAAADVAVPLGDMLDELESIMARQPVGERLDELLELTSKAVDAVDRLRQMASGVSEGAEYSESEKR